MVSNNIMHAGRLANLFFTGLVLHFIAIKNNLKVCYKEHRKLNLLGIELFSGENVYNDFFEILNSNFYNYIISDTEKIFKNIIITNRTHCQTPEFAVFLRNYFNQDLQKNRIIQHNVYKDRYNNNNDVFIHVRLGDIVSLNLTTPIEYYEKALQKTSFENGYISSDSIESELCQTLISKYNLKIINGDEVNAIMFGSTCKKIILSSGTFSWLIGLFSFFAENITYPKIYRVWHGDIFVFPDWHELNYKFD